MKEQLASQPVITSPAHWELEANEPTKQREKMPLVVDQRDPGMAFLCHFGTGIGIGIAMDWHKQWHSHYRTGIAIALALVSSFALEWDMGLPATIWQDAKEERQRVSHPK